MPRPARRDGGAREAHPGARLEVHPGGHAFLLESAGAAAASVLRFLREQEAERAA